MHHLYGSKWTISWWTSLFSITVSTNPFKLTHIRKGKEFFDVNTYTPNFLMLDGKHEGKANHSCLVSWNLRASISAWFCSERPLHTVLGFYLRHGLEDLLQKIKKIKKILWERLEEKRYLEYIRNISWIVEGCSCFPYLRRLPVVSREDMNMNTRLQLWFSSIKEEHEVWARRRRSDDGDIKRSRRLVFSINFLFSCFEFSFIFLDSSLTFNSSMN